MKHNYQIQIYDDFQDHRWSSPVFPTSTGLSAFIDDCLPIAPPPHAVLKIIYPSATTNKIFDFELKADCPFGKCGDTIFLTMTKTPRPDDTPPPPELLQVHAKTGKTKKFKNITDASNQLLIEEKEIKASLNNNVSKANDEYFWVERDKYRDRKRHRMEIIEEEQLKTKVKQVSKKITSKKAIKLFEKFIQEKGFIEKEKRSKDGERYTETYYTLVTPATFASYCGITHKKLNSWRTHDAEWTEAYITMMAMLEEHNLRAGSLGDASATLTALALKNKSGWVEKIHNENTEVQLEVDDSLMKKLIATEVITDRLPENIDDNE